MYNIDTAEHFGKQQGEDMAIYKVFLDRPNGTTIKDIKSEDAAISIALNNVGSHKRVTIEKSPSALAICMRWEDGELIKDNR